MSAEKGQDPAEPAFDRLVAEHWLVGTGRAVIKADGGLRLLGGSDSLGHAALAIVQGEQLPLLAAAYEGVAEVVTLSREVINRVARTAVADFEASSQAPADS